MKRFLSLICLCSILLNSNMITIYAANNSFPNVPKATDTIQIDINEISDKYAEELGLDDLNIDNMEIQTVTANCIDTLARNSPSVNTDVGVLVVESYNTELAMNELSYFLLLEDNGEAVSSARLASSLATTPLRVKDHVQMQGKYKIYTDGWSVVYVNPYQLTLTGRKSGLQYMSGDMMFHGKQVSTSNFADISGTDCSQAYKSLYIAYPFNIGQAYSSTGYFYSSRALRIYSCGFHSNSSMYMEYQYGGTVYKYNFSVGDI